MHGLIGKACGQSTGEKSYQGRELNFSFLVLPWKNIYPLVKKCNNFQITFGLFKNCILVYRDCQNIPAAVRVLIVLSMQSVVKCVTAPLVFLRLSWLCLEAAKTLGRLSFSWRQNRMGLHS